MFSFSTLCHASREELQVGLADDAILLQVCLANGL